MAKNELAVTTPDNMQAFQQMVESSTAYDMSEMMMEWLNVLGKTEKQNIDMTAVFELFQAHAMKPAMPLEALDEMNEIIENAMRQFYQQGCEIAFAPWKSYETYVSDMQRAHTLQGMLMAQVDMFHSFHTQIRDAVAASVSTFSALEVGGAAWRYNTVSEMSKQN